MNTGDNLFLDLMKNPYKSKKKKQQYKNPYIDKLHIELIKRFNEHNINHSLYNLILKKIEIILIENTLKETINHIIEKIENE